MTYALLCVFGLGVGVLSGLLGIGGGIALVPGLMLFFGFSQPQAQGTSLAVLAMPIVLFAAAVYYQHGHVRLLEVGWIAAGFAGGAFVGALMMPSVPQPVLRIGFGVVLLYVGFMFVLAPSEQRAASALPAGLATVLTALMAWVLRRRALRKSTLREPPRDDLEYHL